MRSHAIVLAAALVLAPLGARAADLVVWWEKGFYPQEDEAVREIIAAFEQETGKQVELVYPRTIGASEPRSRRRSRPGSRPTSPSASSVTDYDRPNGPTRTGSSTSTDLRPVLGPVRSGRARRWSTLLNAKTGQSGLYALPMGRAIEPRPRLEEPPGAGRLHARRHPEGVGGVLVVLVRPGAAGRAPGHGPRRHLGRRPAHVGRGCRHCRPGSSSSWLPTRRTTSTRDGRLVIDDPEIRRRLVKAIDGYTAIYRKGCTPPDRSTWANVGNNKAFLAQTVVMTPNTTLSIPNALKRERPDDYYKNTATIEWPLGAERPAASPSTARHLAPWSSRRRQPRAR